MLVCFEYSLSAFFQILLVISHTFVHRANPSQLPKYGSRRVDRPGLTDEQKHQFEFVPASDSGTDMDVSPCSSGQVSASPPKSPSPDPVSEAVGTTGLDSSRSSAVASASTSEKSSS